MIGIWCPQVGVYVSLVSTKVPFKGTSKEYIGDDKGDMHEAIKQSITHCCVQLRSKIVRLAAHRERADRKKSITKYIPDVCRAVFGVLQVRTHLDCMRVCLNTKLILLCICLFFIYLFFSCACRRRYALPPGPVPLAPADDRTSGRVDRVWRTRLAAGAVRRRTAPWVCATRTSARRCRHTGV